MIDKNIGFLEEKSCLRRGRLNRGFFGDFRLRKTSIIFSIAIIFFLGANTVGFDGYFHAISVSSLSSIHDYNSPWILNGVSMPRYIAFHYLMWGMTIFGSLPLYPVLVFVYLHLYKEIFFSHRYQDRISFQRAFKWSGLLVLMVNTVFFSALGFSISFLIASFFTCRRRALLYLICGSLMHPVGLILGVIVALFQKNFMVVIKLLLLLVFFLALFNYSQYNLPYQGREVFSSLTAPLGEWSDEGTASKVFGKLRAEGIYILIIFFVYSLSRSKIISRISFPDIKPTWFVVFALIVAGFSFKSHLVTGGPFGLLLIPFSPEGSVLSREKISIILGTWISPFFFSYEVLTNQYLYRE